MKKTIIALVASITLFATTFAEAKTDPDLKRVKQKAGQIVSANRQPDNGNAFNIGVSKGEHPHEYSIEYDLGISGDIISCEIRVKVENKTIIQTTGVICS
ncbi:hypothetical protein A0159_RS02170 [Acinetobacter baumannii]|uniref:Secreted protein n=1 Tax=Acinetobacter baumannii TaxID=470 RepID=A0AAX0TYN7_ACIBA|nr:hypothetical protein [Acinetobacter baumannii]EHU2374311.1 hypothetical protein [Acinetobacter baumannii]EHU2749911.1 hypothetical protein [Acinetobacter baumannii]MDC4327931.1 hypothetical protein [Acinetobacter baumannii]MDC4390617.1 hypothetical protein [Acinetobacter baumannii]PHQ04577.1 hypothetical protein CPI82_01835 [Acinetobacter baumannii]